MRRGLGDTRAFVAGKRRGENMTEDLHRQIAEATLAGLDLDEIQDAIIDPAPLDLEEKSALWLYAEVLQARPHGRILAELEPVPALV
jgi:hypothetical protein